MTILIDIPKLKVPEDVMERMKEPYPEFPKIPNEDYVKLLDRTEITTHEYNVIHAMQSQIALEILEDKLTDKNYLNLKYAYDWLEPYKKNKFAGYDEAKKHLEAVNKWHMEKTGLHYSLWYIDAKNHIPLLEWSEEMVNRALKKYDEVKKKKRKSVFSWDE